MAWASRPAFGYSGLFVELVANQRLCSLAAQLPPHCGDAALLAALLDAPLGAVGDPDRGGRSGKELDGPGCAAGEERLSRHMLQYIYITL